MTFLKTRFERWEVDFTKEPLVEFYRVAVAPAVPHVRDVVFWRRDDAFTFKAPAEGDPHS